MTEIEFWQMLATKSDEGFIEFASSFGFTPKPEPDAETIENFRMRVVDALTRMGEVML